MTPTSVDNANSVFESPSDLGRQWTEGGEPIYDTVRPETLAPDQGSYDVIRPENFAPQQDPIYDEVPLELTSVEDAAQVDAVTDAARQGDTLTDGAQNVDEFRRGADTDIQHVTVGEDIYALPYRPEIPEFTDDASLSGLDNASLLDGIDNSAELDRARGLGDGLAGGDGAVDVSGQSAFQGAPDGSRSGGIDETSGGWASKASGDPDVTAPRGEASADWGPTSSTSAAQPDPRAELDRMLAAKEINQSQYDNELAMILQAEEASSGRRIDRSADYQFVEDIGGAADDAARIDSRPPAPLPGEQPVGVDARPQSGIDSRPQLPLPGEQPTPGIDTRPQVPLPNDGPYATVEELDPKYATISEMQEMAAGKSGTDVVDPNSPYADVMDFDASHELGGSTDDGIYSEANHNRRQPREGPSVGPTPLSEVPQSMQKEPPMSRDELRRLAGGAQIGDDFKDWDGVVQLNAWETDQFLNHKGTVVWNDPSVRVSPRIQLDSPFVEDIGGGFFKYWDGTTNPAVTLKVDTSATVVDGAQAGTDVDAIVDVVSVVNGVPSPVSGTPPVKRMRPPNRKLRWATEALNAGGIVDNANLLDDASLYDDANLYDDIIPGGWQNTGYKGGDPEVMKAIDASQGITTPETAWPQPRDPNAPALPPRTPTPNSVELPPKDVALDLRGRVVPVAPPEEGPSRIISFDMDEIHHLQGEPLPDTHPIDGSPLEVPFEGPAQNWFIGSRDSEQMVAPDGVRLGWYDNPEMGPKQNYYSSLDDFMKTHRGIDNGEDFVRKAEIEDFFEFGGQGGAGTGALGQSPGLNHGIGINLQVDKIGNLPLRTGDFVLESGESLRAFGAFDGANVNYWGDFLGPSAWGDAAADGQNLVSGVDNADEVAALVKGAPTSGATPETGTIAPVNAPEIEVSGMEQHFAATPGGETGRGSAADMLAPADVAVPQGSVVETTPPPLPPRDVAPPLPPRDAPPLPSRGTGSVPPAGSLDAPPAATLQAVDDDAATYVRAGMETPADTEGSSGRWMTMYADLALGPPGDAPRRDPDPTTYAEIRFTTDADGNEMAATVEGPAPYVPPPQGPRSAAEDPEWRPFSGEIQNHLREDGTPVGESYVSGEGASDGYLGARGAFDRSGTPSDHTYYLMGDKGEDFSMQQWLETWPDAYNAYFAPDATPEVKRAIEAQWYESASHLKGGALGSAPKIPSPGVSPDAPMFHVAVGSLDQSASMYDDVGTVTKALAQAQEANTPESARQLDEVAVQRFDDMGGARGGDNASDYEWSDGWLPKSENDADYEFRDDGWVPGSRSRTDSMDSDVSYLEARDDWVPEPTVRQQDPVDAPKGPNAEYSRGQEEADLEAVLAAETATYQKLEALVKKKQARLERIKAAEEAEKVQRAAKIEYLRRNVAVLQDNLANIKAGPAYKAGKADATEQARFLEAVIDAKKLAADELAAGRDPVQALSARMDDLIDAHGIMDERAKAYAYTLDELEGMEDFLPPTLEEVNGMRAGWSERAGYRRAEARQMMANRHADGVGPGYIERAGWHQTTANKMYAAEAQVAKGQDPRPALWRYVQQLEAKTWMDGGTADVEVSMIKNMIWEYDSIFSHVEPWDMTAVA